jgi:hypothetical protein
MDKTKQILIDELNAAFLAGDAPRIGELQTALANLKVDSVGEKAAELKKR